MKNEIEKADKSFDKMGESYDNAKEQVFTAAVSVKGLFSSIAIFASDAFDVFNAALENAKEVEDLKERVEKLEGDIQE